MPKECAIEMFCDYLGAGRAYQGKNFTYNGEYQWWLKKRENPIAMHPAILRFIDISMQMCVTMEKMEASRIKNFKWLEDIYDEVVEDFK